MVKPADRRPASAETMGLRQEFIQDYGLAYQSFGLPRLMGYIVAVLLQSDEPVSLDEITEELQVSKGPVSQIMRRLREHNLVQRVWVPGSRRDYYRAEPDIFGRAFANHADLLGQNLVLARRYADLIAASEEPVEPEFARRTDEMVRFYALMEKHLAAFLDEWRAGRTAAESDRRPEEQE
jgi:DNA-binding transcriptional regulator GbsR (MarR family)